MWIKKTLSACCVVNCICQGLSLQTLFWTTVRAFQQPCDKFIYWNYLLTSVTHAHSSACIFVYKLLDSHIVFIVHFSSFPLSFSTYKKNKKLKLKYTKVAKNKLIFNDCGTVPSRNVFYFPSALTENSFWHNALVIFSSTCSSCPPIFSCLETSVDKVTLNSWSVFFILKCVFQTVKCSIISNVKTV